MPKITAKFEQDHPLRGQQMQVGWVKIGHFRRLKSNRKSYVLYQMAMFLMILGDP